MNRQLPDRANLEHLRDEAKQVLSELRSGSREHLDIPPPFKLAHAQLVLAREYGFDSWSKLKRYVEGYASRREAFFAAIKAGDRSRVTDLVSEDPSLVRSLNPHDFGAAPITLAANRADIPMIDLLIDAGADPNAKSDWWAGGFCALDFASDEVSDHLISRGARLTVHAAARLGRVDELRRILAAQPEAVNERGGDGQMPLHFAKTPEIVDLLIDAGAEIEARDIDHEGTPAQHAIRNGPVLRRLLEHGAKPDIFILVAVGDASALQRMLDEDPEAIRRTPADPGNPQIPQAPGAHIYTYNIGFLRPDQVASRIGSHDIWQLLFERAQPKLQLLMAAWDARRDLIEDLLQRYPTIVKSLSWQEQRQLSDAASMRMAESVRLMLDIGFDVNVKGADESSPVDTAGFNGFDDIIELVLPYDPDLTTKNVYGAIPLGTCIYGSMHGWRKDGDYGRSVRLLIEAGSPLPREINGSAEVQAVLREYM